MFYGLTKSEKERVPWDQYDSNLQSLQNFTKKNINKLLTCVTHTLEILKENT